MNPGIGSNRMKRTAGACTLRGRGCVLGPGVDGICPGEQLLERFDPDTFDVVSSTAMGEQVREYRGAVSNREAVGRAGGVLLFNTRSARGMVATCRRDQRIIDATRGAPGAS